MANTPFENIGFKLGMVFSRVKDTMVKDFLDDLVQKGASVDSVKGIEEFLSAIIEKIGYDISNAEESNEVYKLIVSIVDASTSLSAKIAELFKDNESIDEIIKSCIDQLPDEAKKPKDGGSSGKLVSFDDFIKNLGSGDNSGISFGSEKFGGSIEFDDNTSIGKLKAIFDIVKELLDLIEKISDIEWNKIAKEGGDFGKFIREKYFTEEFAKRLVDYVLVTFIKNARDVFSDDLELLFEQEKEKLWNSIQSIVSIDKKKFDEIYELIKGYKNTINKLILNEAELATNAVQLATNAVQSEVSGALDSVVSDIKGLSKNQIETYKKILRKKIEELLDQFIPQYNATVKVLNQVYAVLDFLGVISKKKVDLIQYASEKANISGEELGLSKLEIEIPVFRWNLIQMAFSEPPKYLKTVFPVKTRKDLENIIIRISNLARAFNKNFPQIDSIKQFIWELIIRINDKISKDAAKMESGLKAKLESLKMFLLDLLKVCEAIARKTRQILNNALQDFEKGAQGRFIELRNGIDQKVQAVQKTVKQNVNSKLNGSELKEFVVSSFEEAFSENFSKYYSESNITFALNEIDKKIGNTTSNLFSSTKAFVDGLDNEITRFFNAEEWQKRYKKVIIELEKEYKSQNIPDVDDLKKFTGDSIEKLLSGEKIKNPFSDFDPSAYYQILADNLTNVPTLDIYSHYDDFKKKIENNVESLIDDVKKQLNQVDISDAKIKVLVRDTIETWWNKILFKFVDIVIKPYADALKKAVREWIEKIFTEVVDAVKGLIEGQSSSLINVSSYFSSLNFKDVQAVVEGIIELKDSKDSADSLGTWHNAIKFAVNIYKIIPQDIKQYVSELFNLPDLSALKGCLPEYSYDAKDKFLAITLLDKKTSESSQGSSGNASIRIQILAFIGERGEGEEKTEGLFILPLVSGSFDTAFNVGKKHFLKFSAHSELNCKPEDNEKKGTEAARIKDALSDGKLGFFVMYDDKESKTSILPLVEGGCGSAYLEFLFKRGQNGQEDDKTTFKIFDTSIASLSLDNYPQKVFVGYGEKGFDVGYSGGLRKLNLALKLKEQNSFFNAIMKDDIQIVLDSLDLQYSLQGGFKVDNSMHLSIPINADIDLDVVKFKNLGLDIGFDGSSLLSSLLTTFTVDLKGVVISFTDMGLGLNFKFPLNGHKGFDISPKFTYPNGLGISIEVSGVKGGGLVQWNAERQRFAGALELSIMEKVGASAVLVFTTGKGKDPFSLMGGLCVYFNPGIQLGMGFALNGIGGSFGVNRMLSTDNLRDAVYDGSLETILFYKDITENVDKFLANLDKYYPIKTGQMYFGFLGKITWGSILSADLGLFIQAPEPVTIVIAGVVKVSISEKAEKLLVINACFMGGIQFDKGLFFDASLYDSKIVGIELHGDIALRIYWGGKTKGFILTIGGFHPQYKPESGFNLPDLKRVGLKLDYKIIKFSLDAYFAITSNTVQFGTRVDLQIGWEKFGLTGYASFNALFQFKPFKFVVGMDAGLAVKIGSKKICSIDLSFELGGPAKWHAKGKASFWILFVKISVHFDYSWGKDQITSNRNNIDVLPLFRDEFAQKNNWSAISSDLTDNMVSLAKLDGFVLQPSDIISFNQSAVPLGQELGCYGEDNVNDYKKLEIESVYIGSASQSIDVENSSFAPSLIKRLEEKDKLKSPSYKSWQGGFRLSAESNETEGIPQKEVNIKYAGKTTDSYTADRASAWEKAYKLAQASDSSNATEVKPVVVSSSANAASRRLTKRFAGCLKPESCLEFSDVCKPSSENAVNTSSASRQYSRTTRSSYRRSSSGFNRFVKQLDEFQHIKVKNILSEEEKGV